MLFSEYSCLNLSVSSPTVVFSRFVLFESQSLKFYLFPCEGHQPSGAPPLGRGVFSISSTPLLHFRLCCFTPSVRDPFPLSLPVEMWPFWNCSLWIPASAARLKKKKKEAERKENLTQREEQSATRDKPLTSVLHSEWHVSTPASFFFLCFEGERGERE